jgi:hypothetical protein
MNLAGSSIDRSALGVSVALIDKTSGAGSFRKRMRRCQVEQIGFKNFSEEKSFTIGPKAG